MKRRSLILLAVLALLVLAGRPGWADSNIIAIFQSADVPFYNEIVKAFSSAVDADGFVSKNGRQIIVQKPSPDTVAWHNTARKLATMNVGVIVAVGAPAVTTASEETSAVPIVYVGVHDADALGLVASNITGVSAKVPLNELVATMKKTAPFSKPGFIYSRNEVGTLAEAKEFKGLEKLAGFSGSFFNLDDKATMDKITGIDALILSASCGAYLQGDLVIAKARGLKIPSASIASGLEERGIIYTFSPDPGEQGEKAASIVKKILSGTAPSKVPAEKVGKFNLVVNLKEAKAIGQKVPFDVLTAASKVIQ